MFSLIIGLLFLLTGSLNLSGGHTKGLEGLRQIDCYMMPLHFSELGNIHQKGPFAAQKNTIPVAAPSLHIPLGEGMSLNWSGYVAVAQRESPKAYAVSDVYGEWRVPALLNSRAVS